MKSKSLTLFIALIVFVALAVPVRLAAQDNQKSNHSKFITFDAPGAGTGAGQGTFPITINTAGAITGFYIDANNVSHGFVRPADDER